MTQKSLEARKNKYFYMYDGLSSIKSELQDEWIEYVDNYTFDGLDANIIEISIICLKKLKNDINFEIISKTFKELNVEEKIINKIISIVIYFSPKGEEFKNYWQTLHPENKIVEINSSYQRT